MDPALGTETVEAPAPARRLRANLLLLLAAVIWGSAFVAQRVAAREQLGAFLFNGLRFWLGAAVLLPFMGEMGDRHHFRWTKWCLSPFSRWSALAGFLLFAAAWLQQAGMEYTTAGNAGFITGLYVVLVPLILLVVWKQRASWICWFAAGLATLGTYLLSGADVAQAVSLRPDLTGAADVAQAVSLRPDLSNAAQIRLAAGDALVLACAVVFALHVIVVGKAVQKVKVLPFSVGQYFFCGGLSLILGLSLEGETLPRLAACWWAVAYVGVFSVGVAYTLQAVGQKLAPASDAAIILSLEAVFAALFGYLLLGEQMTARQLLGALLMLSAMVLAQIRRPEQRPAESAA
jgi:drug/metabolite transporter (DMT)-like permease